MMAGFDIIIYKGGTGASVPLRTAVNETRKMTASHTTHSSGTKRRKTSVPDWSIQASAESRRRMKDYVKNC